MWRGNNYEEIFGTILQTRYRDDMSIREVADIGADAILEALKKERGVRITKATRMVTQPIFEEADGWLVFILDEEIQNGKTQRMA